MKKLIPLMLLGGFLLGSCNGEQSASQNFAAKGSFQLASPRLQADSSLFVQSASLSLDMAYPGAVIRYTLDGSEVTDESSAYDGPFSLESSALVRARAFHPDCQPSEPVQQQFVKLPPAPEVRDFVLTPQPKAPYEGEGKMSLVDRKRGLLNFRANQAWIGFQKEAVKAEWTFAQPTEVSGLWVGCLIDHGAWIFGPARIRVSTGGRVVTEQNLEMPASAQPSQTAFLKLNFPGQSLGSLKVEIFPPAVIPDWHAGKGTPPWLFLDEIILQ